MRPGFAKGVGVVLAIFASQLIRAEGQNMEDFAGVETVPLNVSAPLRMPPLVGSVEAATALNAGPDTRLSPATRPREFSFVELLLNTAADPLVSDCGAAEALSVAIGLRDIRLLRRVLDKGGDPNAALVQPISERLRRLFENESIGRVFARESGVTPLMIAVSSGQIDAARLLLQRGASTQIHTKVFHMYPLDYAAESKNIPMMQLILGHECTGEGKGHRIVVSLSEQKARLLIDDQVLFVTPVSTGRAGYRTPAGEYVITQKYPKWKSTLYKVPMPNFMRLNCGQTGLHGGVVPGVPASHGCIRLPPKMAATLYGIVQLGDRVSIVE